MQYEFKTKKYSLMVKFDDKLPWKNPFYCESKSMRNDKTLGKERSRWNVSMYTYDCHHFYLI